MRLAQTRVNRVSTIPAGVEPRDRYAHDRRRLRRRDKITSTASIGIGFASLETVRTIVADHGVEIDGAPSLEAFLLRFPITGVRLGVGPVITQLRLGATPTRLGSLRS